MTEPREPRTAAERKAALQDAIIEAVRNSDGVGGIKAFAAYEDFIEAAIRANTPSPLDVDVLPNGICDITGAKHPDLVERRMVKRLTRGNADTPPLSDAVAKARAKGQTIEPGWMDEEQRADTPPPCALCSHTYASHLLGVACCDCIGYAATEPREPRTAADEPLGDDGESWPDSYEGTYPTQPAPHDARCTMVGPHPGLRCEPPAPSAWGQGINDPKAVGKAIGKAALDSARAALATQPAPSTSADAGMLPAPEHETTCILNDPGLDPTEQWGCDCAYSEQGAAQPAPSASAGLQEAVAEAIYDAMREDSEGAGYPWVPGGNSLKQDEARRRARAAIRADTPPLDVELVEAARNVAYSRTLVGRDYTRLRHAIEAHDARLAADKETT